MKTKAKEIIIKRLAVFGGHQTKHLHSLPESLRAIAEWLGVPAETAQPGRPLPFSLSRGLETLLLEMQQERLIQRDAKGFWTLTDATRAEFRAFRDEEQRDALKSLPGIPPLDDAALYALARQYDLEEPLEEELDT